MIRITKTMRQDGTTETDDVLKIKQALTQTGHYKVPDYGLTKYADKELFNAIRGFQKDNRLKQDGVINPNGETLTALNEQENTPENDDPDNAPILRCTVCGGPHGGSKGDLCPSCDEKS